MNKYPEQLDYDDLQAIVQKARMQRSVAVGDAIAGLLAAIVFGLRRAAVVLKGGVSGAKSRAAVRADSRLDVPAHR